VKLLDAEPIGGGRFLILIRGSAKDLHLHAKDAADFELIENIDQEVLDAVYSLAPTKITESLVVAETETAAAMFSLAQTLVAQHRLRPLEIRIRKSGPGGAYAYFTGTRLTCATAAEDARTHLNQKMRKGTIEVIDQPTALVRRLFADEGPNSSERR
jgi:hypothetical protein